jgi:tetratricopeptide (TPR) repeat protein
VELLYDDGGVFSGEKFVSIAHAEKDGTVPPDTSAVRTADRVYFAYRPRGDWTFEEDDRQTLRQITMVQETSVLLPETVRLVGGDEARTAVVGVPKSDVDWLTPVTSRHEIDTSRGLSLKEFYAPGYAPLQRAYDEGRRWLEEGRPFRAVEALRPFHREVEPPFRIVDEARAVLDSATTKALDQARSTYRTLRGDLVSVPDGEGLARLDSFRVRVDSIEAILVSSLEAQPSVQQDVQARLKNLKSSADRLYANARDTYRQNTLRIFMRGKYESPKLRLYLDALTQMLLDRESAFAADGLQVDRLRPSLLETARFAETRRRLQDRGWEGEFREVVSLLNENIREREELFGDKVMESLRLRRPAAPQPYYEIAEAMNALLAGDRGRFSEVWGRALEKVTDLALLNDLQRWRIASRESSQAVPDRALQLAEEARTSWRKGDKGDAEDRLTLAARMADGYAPFYDELGRIKLARGDTAAAQKSYVRARELDSTYAPPEVRRLRLLLAEKEYEQALARADSLVQQQSYWVFYTPKARALVGLERYNDAVPVLQGRCKPLNDKSYALYAVIAKAYAEMGTWEGVRWAIQQAQALTLDRPVFET